MIQHHGLWLSLLVVLGACQTYEKRPEDARVARDARLTREAASRDLASAEVGPRVDAGRDLALETGPDAGPRPDRCSVPASCSVLFSYDKGSESKVELYGSFNAWAGGVAMTLAGTVWQTSLILSHGQQVLYKFRLDENNNNWVPDPKNPKRTTDGFNNSILDVVCPPSC